jgi:hypothetical protein
MQERGIWLAKTSDMERLLNNPSRNRYGVSFLEPEWALVVSTNCLLSWKHLPTPPKLGLHISHIIIGRTKLYSLQRSFSSLPDCDPLSIERKSPFHLIFYAWHLLAQPSAVDPRRALYSSYNEVSKRPVGSRIE